jgi:cystathionine gamma-synthase/methionine-gamma-lyase
VTGQDESLRRYGMPRPDSPPVGPLSPAVQRASAFAFGSAAELRPYGHGERHGDFYPRYVHRNGREFEEQIAALEGTDGAVAFASGMAAISGAILAHCGSGDRVLIAYQVYGGTDAVARHDLPRLGITVDRFDALAAAELARALSRPAKVVLVETPINPMLRVVDVAAVAGLCRRAGSLLFVDATFAPPPIQRLAPLGADLVIHSATKSLGGHADVLAGVVAGSDAVLAPIVAFRSRTGAVIAPDVAWLLCRSLSTLELRVRAQQEAALQLAQQLDDLRRRDDRLAMVHYPGLAEHPDRDLVQRQMQGGGSLVTIELAGGLPAAVAWFDRLRVIARAPSFGGVHSVASLPPDTTHAGMSQEQRAQVGIGEGTVRISVGLEGADRLFADVVQALG